jgi:membrane protein
MKEATLDSGGAWLTSPREIPRRGWFQIAKRVWNEVGADRLSLLAAGVAFFAFLAIFPTLAALTAIWGLVADPAAVEAQIGWFATLLPEAGRGPILEQARSIASAPSSGLGLGTAVALALTLWSASKGMKGLLDGINLAYDKKETRGFFRNNALTLGLTLGAILLAAVAIALVVLLPLVLSLVGLGGFTGVLVSMVRWPLLAVVVLLGLAVLYRIGPVGHDVAWRWVTPGSILATTLWILASIGFSTYVANFGDYDKFYGSIATVVILLMWFFVSAFIVLLGAEVNAETERQSTGGESLRTSTLQESSASARSQSSTSKP